MGDYLHGVQFRRPDMIDMLYIQKVEKGLKNELIASVAISVLGGIVFVVIIGILESMLTDGILVKTLITGLVYFIVSFLLNYLKYYLIKSEPDQYGIAEGTVLDTRLTTKYMKHSISERIEYVDVFF